MNSFRSCVFVLRFKVFDVVSVFHFTLTTSLQTIRGSIAITHEGWRRLKVVIWILLCRCAVEVWKDDTA